MFSPQDIRETEFDKIVRGYNPDDVDAFLSGIADQMESLQKDKADAENKMVLLAERLEEFKKDEDTLRSALITAERLKEAVLNEARQKADVILTEARTMAEKLTSEATAVSERLMGDATAVAEAKKKELSELQIKVDDFKHSMLLMYKQHLELIEQLPEVGAGTEFNAPATEEVPAEEPAVEEPVPVEEEKFFERPSEESLFFGEEEKESVEPAGDLFAFETVESDFAADEPAPAVEEPVKEEAPVSRFGKLDFGDNFTFEK